MIIIKREMGNFIQFVETKNNNTITFCDDGIRIRNIRTHRNVNQAINIVQERENKSINQSQDKYKKKN